MSLFARKLLRWVGLALCISLLPSTLHANSVTVFSTFGPNHSFDCCATYSISGGTNLPNFSEAMAFTPTVLSTLQKIDIAVTYNTVFSNAFSLALMTSTMGQPGSILESWNLTTPFAVASCGNCFVTALSAQQIVLQPGTQYWVAAFPAGNIDGNWNRNIIGAVGTVASSGDGGKTWTISPNGQVLGAFDVIGGTSSTVPEPGTLVLLGSGLLGTIGLARRRLPKQK